MRWRAALGLVWMVGLAGPARAETVVLDRPAVLDTATLLAGDGVIALSGIDGVAGEAAQHLRDFLATGDGRLTCAPQPDTRFVCRMSDGADLAQVVLINGAARTREDASAYYRQQEEKAQMARRGVWAKMPVPPKVLTHPAVQDTATLWADGTKYGLQGVIGLGAPYAAELQDAILARGDRLTYVQQFNSGHFVCVLRDGTDVAEMALKMGAARLGRGAPASYRMQQLDAVNNRRGTWQTASDAAITAAQPVSHQNDETAVSGDDGTDRIRYAGGEPEVMIDGAAVFLVYADSLGWGYYDHLRHWRDAPARFRAHLERLDPDGDGLPGNGGSIRRHEEAERRIAVAPAREETLHQNLQRDQRLAVVRPPVVVRPVVARVVVVRRPAGTATPAPRPAATASGSSQRPTLSASAGSSSPTAPVRHAAATEQIGIHR
jgi:endonuclease YncB( thermonuclease family)